MHSTQANQTATGRWTRNWIHIKTILWKCFRSSRQIISCCFYCWSLSDRLDLISNDMLNMDKLTWVFFFFIIFFFWFCFYEWISFFKCLPASRCGPLKRRLLAVRYWISLLKELELKKFASSRLFSSPAGFWWIQFTNFHMLGLVKI